MTIRVLLLQLLLLTTSIVPAQSSAEDAPYRFEKLKSHDLLAVRAVPYTTEGGEFGMRLSGIIPGSFWDSIKIQDNDLWLGIDEMHLTPAHAGGMLTLIGILLRDTQKPHELHFLRGTTKFSRRILVAAPARRIIVHNVFFPNSSTEMTVAEDYCNRGGFNEWTTPPLAAEAERACDRERIANFSKTLGQCISEAEAKEREQISRVKFFDLDRDRCVTCKDFTLWKQLIQELFRDKNRSTNGSELSAATCERDSHSVEAHRVE